MQDLDKFKNEMNLSGKNVYVGHRYVPKIMGEWDNTKIYEPLSIVQYQGASYTSRQYVPVGVEINNEEFWVVTGNYNAQVEQYRQDVRNLETNVNNVNGEVIAARNGEPTLRNRLDKEHQNVTARLAQTATLVSEYGDSVLGVQSAVNQGGHVIFEKGKTYNLTDTLTITKPTKIDLNGAIVNFNLTSQIPAFFVQSDSVTIQNGTINVVGTVMGGSGHALNCISAGNQSDGSGYDNLTFKNLTLSTNRNDAGATIGIFGECTNVLIENIFIPDNDRCRNIIGLEWGGTPELGTGHPHNIVVRNIDIGRLTYPTFGGSGFGFAVWASACYNVTVENVVMEEGYGLAMVTRGDHSNTYAPEKYKNLIGTGISFKNMTIKGFYGFALRNIGSYKSTTLSSADMGATFEKITAIGKKVDTNNNIGFQVEQSKGVTIKDFHLSGDYYVGVSTGINVEELSIINGFVTKAEAYGVSFGNGVINSVIRDVVFIGNNANRGEGVTTSAIVLANCINTLVENCTFGKIGEFETQKYSITATTETRKPKLNNNHTNNLFTDGIAYLLGASTNPIDAVGVNNTAEDGLKTHGGAPIFQKTPYGNRVFWDTNIPTAGTYKKDDIVYLTNRAVGGTIGAVCVEAGTPGVWKTFGTINV